MQDSEIDIFRYLCLTLWLIQVKNFFFGNVKKKIY